MRREDMERLIDVEYIKKLQDVIWRLFGFSFYILDTDNREFVGFDKIQPICRLIKSYPKGKECCDISDAAILGDAKLSQKMICRKCMAVGLTDVAIPIIMYDKHIATIFMGQINSHGLTAEAVRKFAREIGADENKMVKAYKKMQFVEMSYLEPILELMQLLAENISAIMEANANRINYENENQKNSRKIYREYDMQLFMNDLYRMLFIESEYTIHTLNTALNSVKEFLGFEKIAVYRDVSGNGSEFVPEVGDISDMLVISGDDTSILYGVEKYGFVCYDETNDLSRYTAADNYITVAIPFFADRRFSGFINMSSKERKRIFTVSEINLFKNIAGAVGNFYYRMYADRKLKEAGIITDSIFEK